MRKGLFAFSMSLFCVFLQVQSSPETNAEDAMRRIHSAVASIVTYDQREDIYSHGTGFFVDSKRGLVSNYHVLQGAYDAKVLIYDGGVFRVTKVVAADPTVDLIKLRVSIPQDRRQRLNLTDQIPSLAEHLMVIGGPMAPEPQIREGIFASLRKIPKLGTFLQISAPVTPGFSGSPVITADGKVVGVVSFQIRAGKYLNFAIPSRFVLRLQEEQEGRRLSDWTQATESGRPGLSESTYRKGLSFFTHREYERALPFFEDVAVKNRGHAGAWYKLGYCYYRKGSFLKALIAYRHVIEIEPDHPETFYNLGCTYAKLGRPREAVKAYKKALAINPRYPEALYNLGLAYQELGDHEVASVLFQRLLEIRPNDPEAHYHLGISYLKEGKEDSFLVEYKILQGLDQGYALRLREAVRKKSFIFP